MDLKDLSKDPQFLRLESRWNYFTQSLAEIYSEENCSDDDFVNQLKESTTYFLLLTNKSSPYKIPVSLLRELYLFSVDLDLDFFIVLGHMKNEVLDFTEGS